MNKLIERLKEVMCDDLDIKSLKTIVDMIEVIEAADRMADVLPHASMAKQAYRDLT